MGDRRDQPPCRSNALFNCRVNKKIAADVYSVRVGLEFRALAFDRGTHLTWFWIGPHDEYERLIS